jgi:hypothetical protein
LREDQRHALLNILCGKQEPFIAPPVRAGSEGALAASALEAASPAAHNDDENDRPGEQAVERQ